MNYILGASGHGKVVWNILHDRGIAVDAFIEADTQLKEVLGVTVKHDENIISGNDSLIIGVGNNQTRKAIASRVNAQFIQAVHPGCYQGVEVKIGNGTVVMPGVTINASTTIGAHVILNTQASIDHDCIIGDFSHLAPGVVLCGGVEIGEGTLIGVGAQVIPLIKIGKWVTIGAGAVITEDVPDYAVVVGNPGRVIRFNKG